MRSELPHMFGLFSGIVIEREVQCALYWCDSMHFWTVLILGSFRDCFCSLLPTEQSIWQVHRRWCIPPLHTVTSEWMQIWLTSRLIFNWISRHPGRFFFPSLSSMEFHLRSHQPRSNKEVDHVKVYHFSLGMLLAKSHKRTDFARLQTQCSNNLLKDIVRFLEAFLHSF